MLRTNQENFDKNIAEALRNQERWRRKQIETLYLQGRPIFEMNTSVKDTVKKWYSEMDSIKGSKL